MGGVNPSLFAKFIKDAILTGSESIVELGCGNGRDAVFFANEGFHVCAIDQCENEIKFLTTICKDIPNISFQAGDFSDLDDIIPVDVIYSRFSLHSISKKQETATLHWAYRNLLDGGHLCIEVRGQNNEIYGMGDKVEDENDAYIYDNHYRRFLNFNELCSFLQTVGFQIIMAKETIGFAPFDGRDETYIRVIAKK
jgi:tellurite methyltransferase